MTRRTLFATIAAALAGAKLAPVIAPVVAPPLPNPDLKIVYFPVPYGASIQIPRSMLENDELQQILAHMSLTRPKVLLSVPDGFEAWSHGRRLRRGDSYTSLYLISKP